MKSQQEEIYGLVFQLKRHQTVQHPAALIRKAAAHGDEHDSGAQSCCAAHAVGQGPTGTAMLGTKSSFAALVSYKDKNSAEKVKHREIKKLKRRILVADLRE